MLTLGVDTATRLGALALARDGAVLGVETIVEDVEHSAELGPALDRLLERCGAKLDELDGIGVGLGPGSYTGLRVGVAFAKGLEFGLRVPLVGVPSFEAIAYACRGYEGTICALVDARMGGIYAGLYRARGDAVEVVREPWVSKEGGFTLDVEGPLLFIGPDEAVMTKLGARFDKAVFRQAHPDASYTALRAAQLLVGAPPGARFADIEPYYLRPSFAELAARQAAQHAAQKKK
jgi:tRNA threonylcarbamoyladenosine biosynthesis protein TsaB